MKQIISESTFVPVFVVDRFYCSTCSYTIGRETFGTEEDIEHLLDEIPSLVEWPKNLLIPDICIILRIGRFYI